MGVPPWDDVINRKIVSDQTDNDSITFGFSRKFVEIADIFRIARFSL